MVGPKQLRLTDGNPQLWRDIRPDFVMPSIFRSFPIGNICLGIVGRVPRDGFSRSVWGRGILSLSC